MATSLIAALQEEARQQLTGDTEYVKRGVWVFRILTERFKGPAGADGTAVFPLPVPPDQFRYTLPFGQEVTVAQEGGVIAEEGGINTADIRISATTGFKLRPQQTLTFAPGGGVFTGLLGELGGLYQDISGQLSFWILANRCFEGYSQLKKDPQTAHKTQMELHVYKDGLHLEVVPVTFALNRSAAKERVTYRYEIDLKAIGEAKAIDFVQEDEKDIFDELSDNISKIRNSIQSIGAAIDDVTAAIDELSRAVSSVTRIVEDVGSILTAAGDFVNGVTDFLNYPRDLFDSVTALTESAADAFADIAGFPADVAQTFMSISDELDKMKVAARNNFKSSYGAIADKYNKLNDPFYGVRDSIGSSARNKRDEQDAAAAQGASSQGRMTVSDTFGGSSKPGDAARRTFTGSERRLNRDAYSGFEDRVVGQGDTIQGLAAKHLGDAKKWMDLALANSLKPPWITSGAKLPNTLQPGSTISIPISRPEASTNVLSTGSETASGESQAVANLGTDFELVQQTNGKWAWAIDSTHGSTDARKISGINNLGQAIQARLRTVRGENIMFPSIGMPRLIGMSPLVDQRTEAQLRVRQQIVADSRIERMIEYSFSFDNDALVVNAKVVPKGFATPRVISRAIT